VPFASPKAVGILLLYVRKKEAYSFGGLIGFMRMICSGSYHHARWAVVLSLKTSIPDSITLPAEEQSVMNPFYISISTK
jgi:hypothetical protein